LIARLPAKPCTHADSDKIADRLFDERGANIMAERRTTYDLQDLIASGNGELLGPGRAQLPLPPLLMFDCIEAISATGGAHGRGLVIGVLKIADNPRLDWIFSCHFSGDPVMPGS
jgi:3-hydroxyacyl-[acyl-carrier protein] dehydratase/trans-2-decenoyl-[acyl-carrier protein] isomerase